MDRTGRICEEDVKEDKNLGTRTTLDTFRNKYTIFKENLNRTDHLNLFANNIKMNLKETRWEGMAQNSVNTAINLQVPSSFGT